MNGRGGARRRALSLVEVLFATLVVVAMLIPLMTSGSSMHLRTHASESYALGLARARLLVSLAEAVDFELLDRAAAGATGAMELPLERFLEPGAFETLLAAQLPGPESVEYARRVAAYRHRVTYTRRDARMGELRVLVTWRDVPGGSGPEHRVELTRLLYRPEGTLSDR